MSTLRISLAAVAILVAGTATASVTPIGEFTGDMYEGFENLNPPGGYPAPFPILDGQGTFDDINAHYCMIATSLYSFPTNTYIYPYNGNFMGGSVTGWAAFEFTVPVMAFGGYIGTADDLSGGYVNFKDLAGNIIDTVPFTVGVGQWGWFGWSSDLPISRIEVIGSTTIGLPLVFDDLRASVPEPAALTLVALGAAFLLGRRR